LGQAAAVVWKITFPAGERGRYLVAIVAGLMLAISFPKLGLAGMAWVAPGLILVAAIGCEGGAAFRIGYMAGLAHHLASLYWLLLIPVPLAPVVGWLALAAFLALYPATWVWLCWKIYPAALGETSRLRGTQSSGQRTQPMGERPALRLLDQFLSTTWLQRLAWTLCCAALWVTCEMVRARLFSGFPWNFLGASQYRMVPLIQMASLTGVYGVSFLVTWFSVSLIGAAASVMRSSGLSRSWAAELMLPLFVAIGAVSFGFRQFVQAPSSSTLKIALIQPSIPQTMIWDAKESATRFRQLIGLSEQALTHKPDLLVWPEAAVPSIFRWDTNQIHNGQTIYEATTGLARRHKVWLIMGADDSELNLQKPDRIDYFNSSFLINPDGEVLASYRKQRLVIFGEYVPLSRWLPFLKDFTQVYGEFTPGIKPVTFHLPELKVKTSVLICFEDVFPHLVRKHVEEDTDFLLNLTNNGWFGESAAQWQHAASAVFRAVENGLPLVRAANNGLTCWVDSQGRMHDVYFPDSKNIYKPGFKIVQVPLLAAPKREETVYHRRGDLFGWSCVGFGGLVVGWLLAHRKGRNVQVANRD